MTGKIKKIIAREGRVILLLAILVVTANFSFGHLQNLLYESFMKGYLVSNVDLTLALRCILYYGVSFIIWVIIAGYAVRFIIWCLRKMRFSVRLMIILSGAVILIVVFLGLKTESLWSGDVILPSFKYTLSLYGISLYEKTDFLFPEYTVAKIGPYKYWLCGIMLLIGGALFMATRK